MQDPKSFLSHDAEGDNVTKDFWIAHFGHATEYNQLDEDRRYNGFGGFIPSLQGSRADDGEDAITYDGSGIDANNAAQQRAQRQNRLHTGLGASRTH